MKNSLAIITLLFGSTLFISCNQQNKSQGQSENKISTLSTYFGHTPPELTAKLFNGGEFFENEYNKARSFGLAFSPDGKEMFFSFIRRTPEKPEPAYEIKISKFTNNKWSLPETANFSGVYSDVDINFSPDGKYLFFSSDRPDPNSGRGGIYYSIKNKDGWSEPNSAGSEVNTKYEAWPSVSTKGNLFFQSHRAGGYGEIDLYRAEWFNGRFTNVKNLGSNINTQYNDYHASIAPDESYILFCTRRPINGDKTQIYISFQISENIWTKAKSVGPKINTDLGGGGPTFSPDGKFLFFSKKNGIHWISTKFIGELRPLELLKKE